MWPLLKKRSVWPGKFVFLILLIKEVREVQSRFISVESLFKLEPHETQMNAVRMSVSLEVELSFCNSFVCSLSEQCEIFETFQRDSLAACLQSLQNFLGFHLSGGCRVQPRSSSNYIYNTCERT